MSKWTHCICEKCWNERNPERAAIHIVSPEMETCCYCGEESNSGIYVRDNPNNPGFCNHEE